MKILCLVFALLCSAPAWSADDQVVFSQSANGSRNTRPFTATAGWEVRWDSNAPSLSIWILDKEGNPVEHAASQDKAGKGASYYAKPGTFSLKITARGDWTITVVQLP